MRKIDNRYLININGGASISGSLISAMVRGINSVLEVGRALGTAIWRIKNKKYCK